MVFTHLVVSTAQVDSAVVWRYSIENQCNITNNSPHVMVGVGRPFAWLFIRKLSPMFTEKFFCFGLVILGESVEIFES